jgi:hypothetical protein
MSRISEDCHLTVETDIHAGIPTVCCHINNGNCPRISFLFFFPIYLCRRIFMCSYTCISYLLSRFAVYAELSGDQTALTRFAVYAELSGDQTAMIELTVKIRARSLRFRNGL